MIPIPQTPTTSKQYLLVLDDVTMVIIGRICPSLRFIEVEGMPMKDCTSHTLLVNPVAVAIEPIPIAEETPAS